MKNKIFFSIFIILWLVLFVFNLFAPKATFSEEENRYLAKWPVFTWSRFLDGQYAKDIETYINDHFIFRKEWVALKTVSEQAIGKTEINGVYIGKEGYLFEKLGNNLKNMKQAVENIDILARKNASASIFYASTKFDFDIFGKITRQCSNNKSRRNHKRRICDFRKCNSSRSDGSNKTTKGKRTIL